MSARFPAPCPSSKLITAQHNWYGFATFSFPGFKGTFSGQTFTGSPSDTGGSWSGGGVPSLAVGDLVLSQVDTNFSLHGGPSGYYVYKLTTAFQSGWPSIDPQIDCVGSIYSYPDITLGTTDGSGNYTFTGLIVGVTYAWETAPGWTFNGSAPSLGVTNGTLVATSASVVITGPASTSVNSGIVLQFAAASAHFTLWDYKVIGSTGAEEGPTAYPLIDSPSGSAYLSGYDREVWGTGVSGADAYLVCTITNDFSGMSGSGQAGTDVIVETWTVNKYTGSVADSGPSPTPTTPETKWMFPQPAGIGLGAFGTTNITPMLVSLSASASSLAFEMGYSIGGVMYTYTQTIALSSENSLAGAITDCTTLLSGNAGSQSAEFAALSWGQQATCTYSSSGTVNVSVSSIGTTGPEPVSCLDGVPGGTTATAATGYGYNALTSGKDISMATALIDVCGPYCERTYHCTGDGTVDCSSGTVDGYAPVTIAVPSLGGGETQVWVFLFPNCQCT